MTATPLRAIAGDALKSSHKVSALLAAASSGSRHDLLLALRDEIARRIDEGVPDRDLASLSLRLMSIAKDLEEFESAEGTEVAHAVAVPDAPFDPS